MLYNTRLLKYRRMNSMITNQLNDFQDLERELFRLKEHFEYFQDSDPKELVDWALYFQQWANRASHQGLTWVRPYLELANLMVSNLGGRRAPAGAFDLMLRAMRGAQRDMRREIDQLQPEKIAVGF
jgi:hypothetical protein